MRHKHRSPEEAKCQQARRQSLQPPSSPPSTTREGNTKRCSGEFEFKKVRRKSREWNHLSQVLGELGKAEEQEFMERMVRGELVGDSVSEGSGESHRRLGVTEEGEARPREEGRHPGGHEGGEGEEELLQLRHGQEQGEPRHGVLAPG